MVHACGCSFLWLASYLTGAWGASVPSECRRGVGSHQAAELQAGSLAVLQDLRPPEPPLPAMGGKRVWPSGSRAPLPPAHLSPAALGWAPATSAGGDRPSASVAAEFSRRLCQPHVPEREAQARGVFLPLSPTVWAWLLLLHPLPAVSGLGGVRSRLCQGGEAEGDPHPACPVSSALLPGRL